MKIRINEREVDARAGSKLLHAIMDAGIPIETACGGKGACHLCRVTITDGTDELPAPNAIEKRALGNVLIAQKMRLACQIFLDKTLSVEVPKPRERKRRGMLQPVTTKKEGT